MRMNNMLCALALFALMSAPAYAQRPSTDDDSPGGLEAEVTSTTSGTATVTAASSGSSDEDTDRFVMDRDDITEAAGEALDPADITTETELVAYVQSIMTADKNIMRVEADLNGVSVWYKEPARFLGLIPVSVTAKATAFSDGKVEVSYPWWYDVFAIGADSERLIDTLKATAGAIALSEGSTDLSTNARARLINALRASLKMNFEQGASTSSATSSRDLREDGEEDTPSDGSAYY